MSAIRALAGRSYSWLVPSELRSLDPRDVRHLHLLMRNALLFALAMVLVVACQPASLDAAISAANVMPDAVVRLDEDLAIAAKLDGNVVKVIEFSTSGGGWGTKVIGDYSPAEQGGISVHLFTYGGESDAVWNSFVFGTAPPQGSRVELAGFDGTGGQVSNGAWVVALKEKDLLPPQLEWTLIDALGKPIASGSGTT